MRCNSFARSTPRSARFERCEDRLVFSSVPWAEVCEVGVESAEECIRDSPDVMKWDPTSNFHDHETLFSTPSEQIRDTYGFQGEGQTVAIIDSGIAWDHVALGGGFGEGYQVVGGWDFTEENDADPYDDGPAGFHGTHVAGIIGAESATHVGVAPGVDLVGLRVFNDQGLGYADWVEQALSWVREHQNDFRFPITTVNLSLGAAWNGDSPPEWAMLEDELAQLTQDGILVSAAAGNSFARYGEPGLSYPAASPHVVPVASVGDDGQLSDFSQRHQRVLAAPGELITSTVPDHIFGADGNMDDWAAISGTSMAAPYVAGASVLVREAMQFVDEASIAQSDIHEHLCRTADPIFDALTDTFYHRLNLTQAIESLMPADDYGSSLDTAFDLGVLQAEQTLSGHLARLDDHDVFQFTAAANGELEWEAIGDREFGVTWLSTNGEVLEQSDQSSIQLKAGRTYALMLSAGDYVTHFDVRMSFTPDGVVTVDGNVVRVNGTADSDTISFWVDDRYRLEVNGEQYSYDMDVAWTFELHGGGGDDELTVSGGAGNETVFLWAGRARMTGPGYALVADEFSSITVLAGSGVEDIAHLFGTNGNDRFVASPSSASLSGSGYSNRIAGFTQVFAYAETGRNDIAWLYDSAGDDEFKARPGDGVLQGPGYFINAVDFNRVYAHASSGTDSAQLFDSNHGDLFVGTPHAGWMQGYGFFHKARGFDRVEAHASGGYDRARFYDSLGNELFVSTPEAAWMRGDTFLYKAWHFDFVSAYAFGGGYDEARFHGPGGDNTFVGRPNAGWMHADSYFHRVQYFDHIHLVPVDDGETESPTLRRAGGSPGDDSMESPTRRQSGTNDPIMKDPPSAPAGAPTRRPHGVNARLDRGDTTAVRDGEKLTRPGNNRATDIEMERMDAPPLVPTSHALFQFERPGSVFNIAGAVFHGVNRPDQQLDSTDGGLMGELYLTALDHLFMSYEL